MLLGLRNFLEFPCGQTGRAWLHQPGNFSREAIYEKLLAPGGLFREDAIEILHPGKPFMLSTDRVRLPGVTAAERSEFPRRAWGDSIASNFVLNPKGVIS
jgi:hypothetical protein